MSISRAALVLIFTAAPAAFATAGVSTTYEGGQAANGLTFEPAVTAAAAVRESAALRTESRNVIAAPAFEGGQAANGLTFEPNVPAAPRARADVRTEARSASVGSRAYEGGLAL